jgi:preprotein translocase subunit SecE
MARDQQFVQGGPRRGGPVVESDAAPKTNLIQSITNLPTFFREVQAEARKVTWTSWRETWITSVMVGIMVIITALFFFVLDTVLRGAVDALLKLANAG